MQQPSATRAHVEATSRPSWSSTTSPDDGGAARILHRNGYDVLAATSLSEAVTFLSDNDVRRPLTDSAMAGMFGSELADIARRLCPGLLRCSEMLIQKPFNAGELPQTVDLMLRRSPQLNPGCC